MVQEWFDLNSFLKPMMSNTFCPGQNIITTVATTFCLGQNVVTIFCPIHKVATNDPGQKVVLGGQNSFFGGQKFVTIICPWQKVVMILFSHLPNKRLKTFVENTKFAWKSLGFFGGGLWKKISRPNMKKVTTDLYSVLLKRHSDWLSSVIFYIDLYTFLISIYIKTVTIRWLILWF